MFLLIIFLFPINYCYPNTTLYNKYTNNCLTYEKDSWKVYNWYFKESRALTINVLITRQYHKVTNYYVDDFLKLVYYRGFLDKTVRVSNIHLNSKRKRNIEDVDWNITYSEQKKIRRQRMKFGKPETAYIIIVWNETILKEFLRQNSVRVIPNSRATYLVLIIENHAVACIRYTNEIYGILSMLWLKHKVLNAIALAPCSCNPRDIYIFDPFYYNEIGKSWGKMHTKSQNEVFEHPESIINTLDDLKGYPIRISVFNRTPTNLRFLPKNLYHFDCSYVGVIVGGLDGCVMSHLARYLGFKLIMAGPKDGESFGYKISNGTYLGSLGDIQYGRADIAGNGRFLEIFDSESFEFTTPVKNDLICFVVPKSDKIPEWMAIFNCFKSETWVALIFVTILMGILFNISKKISGEKSIFIVNDIISVCGLLLNAPLHKPPTITHQRILLISCMMFNVIIIGAFQGSLFTSFSSNSYYPDINTLEELANSDLQIATSLDIFKENDVGPMKVLYFKQIALKERALTRASVRRDVAAVERREDAHFFSQIKYISKDGYPKLHVVEECPISNFLAYIVPKNSPFLPKFNAMLTTFLEAGLVQKWYLDTVEAIVLVNQYERSYKTEEQKPFSLVDVQTAFYSLFIGSIVSTLVLFGEILNQRRKEMLKQHVNYKTRIFLKTNIQYRK